MRRAAPAGNAFFKAGEIKKAMGSYMKARPPAAPPARAAAGHGLGVRGFIIESFAERTRHGRRRAPLPASERACPPPQMGLYLNGLDTKGSGFGALMPQEADKPGARRAPRPDSPRPAPAAAPKSIARTRRALRKAAPVCTVARRADR